MSAEYLCLYSAEHDPNSLENENKELKKPCMM